jgi:hypothetical protein
MVVTGGIFVVNIKDFGPATPHKLAAGSEADIWLQPRIVEVGAPFLMVYSRYGPPYSLNLRNWDGGGKYKSIHISEISVGYDGNPIAGRRAVDLTEGVKLTRDPRFHTARSLISVPDAVVFHTDNKASIRGWLEKPDGKKTPFTVSLDFAAQQQIGFAPYWIALANKSK